MNQKDLIRKKYRYINKKKDYICDKIFSIIKGKSVLIYMPLKNELYFDKIIDKLDNDFNLYVPYAYKDNTMEFHLLKKDFIKDELNILSTNGNKILKEKLDCIIIPGLCFNKSGYRLGHGKGYYDREFKDYQGLKIGICYDDCIIDDVFQEEFDIKVDYIVSEKDIYIIK